jgi:hypothetical protein
MGDTKRNLFILLLAFVASVGSIRAELPLIRLDRIFPIGGQAGTEVALEVAGRDMEEVKTLHVDHPGFKATYLKDGQFKLTIAADVPPGTYEVRAVGRFGISGARLFQVSRALTEISDKEPNDSPEQAQPVPMNYAVNGRSDGNGDDYFRFPAKKGQRVTIDCYGLRLDSTLRAILVLSSSDGKQLQQSKPYYERTDPLLDFTAPADGDYIVRLYDLTYSGGLPYRLIISDRPHIEHAFPMAGVPGTKPFLTLLGRNLPGGKANPAWVIHDQPLEEMKVIAPASPSPTHPFGFDFRQHLASPSVGARGQQFFPFDSLNPVTLVRADAEVTLDQEPNDAADKAQAIALPTVIAGRFDKPGDADGFSFKGKANDVYTVDLLCERLGLPGDPFVIIFDSKGNELQTADDHGINFNALAQANRDPQQSFRVPADGEFRVFVQERYRNGGARYQYVLRLVKAVPDFFPVVVHETPNEPSCPTIWRGGSAHYDVCLNRRDGNFPVTIEAEGLPKGVVCPPVTLSPQTQTGAIVFTAAADAPEWAGPIKLKAWAVVDGQKIERDVWCVQRRWAIANINTSVALRQTCLAVRDQAPYAIKLPTEKLTVAAGGALDAKAMVSRLWPDFKGKMQLTGLNLPPGFAFATTDIAADKTETPITFKVAANVPPGDYTLFLRGDAQVPYSRDPKATNRPNVRVADPSTGLTVTVRKAEKK